MQLSVEHHFVTNLSQNAFSYQVLAGLSAENYRLVILSPTYHLMVGHCRLLTADCSDLASRVKSGGKVIVYTGTIAKATTCGREQ
jgi:hypothetical protein